MKTLTPIQSAIIDSLSNQFAPLPKTSDSQLAMLAQFFKGEDLRCIAQPITRNLRENIENCILEKYQEISSQEE